MQTNGQSARLLRERFYRARAHSNPLSDYHFPIPISPSDIDYSQHFPHFFPRDPRDDSEGDASPPQNQICRHRLRVWGIACQPLYPFPRYTHDWNGAKGQGDRVCEGTDIGLESGSPRKYENISVVRTNSMKYLPNHFGKAQLSKMFFFLFPDPHFKEKNHRRRVISPQLLDEYAYALEVGGVIYTITVVEELGDWMRSCMEDHPLFEGVPDEELEADPVVKLLTTATEESQKVARNGGQTFRAVLRRVALEDE